VKFLHTSDWHVGKTLAGKHRHEEQTAVLGEIVDIALREQVDAVLLAGDLYDSTAPTAEAQRLLVRTLLTLADAGIEVVAMAGNHDHPGTFDAYRPLMAHVGIHLLGRPRDAESGGVHAFTARSTGEPVRVAVLPFVSQRSAVRAAEIIANTPAQNTGLYADLVRASIAALSAGFRPDAVNVVMAHLTCIGAKTGGGERDAHTVFDYAVPVTVFPHDASYVALGHLHRRQVVPAVSPVHYSGSPLTIDFGEEENDPVVCVVEAHPGLPAQVRDVPITSSHRFRTLRGTVEQLTALAEQEDFADEVLRVFVTQPSFVGLREAVLGVLPNAVQIRIDPEHSVLPGARASRDISTQTPARLFADFCADRHIDDARLTALFDELYDSAASAELGD
jgi:exonuclease SbcD